MDRKQHDRIVIDDSIKQLIDDWHICPYSDKVDELFDTLRGCAEAYLDPRIKRSLNTMIRVNIVKDMRGMLNPHRNTNLYYFTDKICDTILRHFKDINYESLDEFNAYIQECLLHVYTRA